MLRRVTQPPHIAGPLAVSVSHTLSGIKIMNLRINYRALEYHSIFLVILCSISFSAFSQKISDTSSSFKNLNTINIELGGFTPIGTICYERVFINRQKFKTTGQIGYGVEGIPLVINELLSFRNNHIEIGIGVLIPEHLTSSLRDITKPFLTGRLGFRYQKTNGRFVFRLGLMPIATQDSYGMNVFTDDTWYVWPGFSFGYAF